MSLYHTLCQLGFNSDLTQNGALPQKIIILFVALGILLVVILVILGVYLIYRQASNTRSEVGKSKSEITSAETGRKIPVDALPQGTALHDGLYIVEEYLSASEGIRTYRVRRTQPFYLCPQCDSELSDDVDAFCRVCGATLGVVPPTFRQYKLKVSKKENAFSIEKRIIEMNLKHSSLVLPLEMFIDSAMDTPEYFVVEPLEQEPVLTESQLPLPVDTVLAIGGNLAEGLTYLHSKHTTLKHMHLEDIVYLNNQARWLCYKNIHFMSEEESDNDSGKSSNNVIQLTSILEKALIGDKSATTTIEIPKVIQDIINQYSQISENNTADKLVKSLRQAVRMLGGHNQAQYHLGAKSDVGRLRKLNEDSMLLRDLTPLYQDMGVSVVIGGVADGVGGQAAGDVASQLTVSSLDIYLDDLQEQARMGRVPEPYEWLVKASNSANEAVYKERTKAGNNMACTLVLAFFTGDLATILNVGDSRAYLLNNRGLRQITTDHSLVERLVAIGEITREEARHHPRKSVIYRVIGDRLNLDLDIYTQNVMPGEALLMCSDGLSDMVEDATIWRIWREATSPQDAADQLVTEANAAGGVDNITVIIIEVVG
jgi:protein phosphatase